MIYVTDSLNVKAMGNCANGLGFGFFFSNLYTSISKCMAILINMSVAELSV